MARPGNQKRWRAKDDVGAAIWNDARSIAYLRWVTRGKLPKHKRMVFITGDLLIFDAYRRWYFNGDEEAEPGEKRDTGADPSEPFFMRRATQYAPLLNPFDSGGDLTNAEDAEDSRTMLFSLIQAAVEAILLVIFPEEVDQAIGSPESITDARRELLALGLIDRENVFRDPRLAPLSRKLSEGWVESSTAAIHKNRDLWQRLEYP